MKTMTNDFVTAKAFNRAMKRIDERFSSNDYKFNSIDKRFDAVDRQFDEIKKDIEIKLEEQRVIITRDTREMFEVFMEAVNHRFAAMMEHPLFANYKA